METGKVLIYIVKTVLSTIAMAVILFASAGTPDWAAGWAYVGLVSIGTVASMLIVDTELLAERSQVGQGAQTIDVVPAVTLATAAPLPDLRALRKEIGLGLTVIQLCTWR